MAEANGKLKKDDVKLAEVGKMLSAACKKAKAVDMEVIEYIEITEEMEFLTEELGEFEKMEASGAFEAEDSAVDAIVSNEHMMKASDGFEKKSHKASAKVEVKTK